MYIYLFKFDSVRTSPDEVRSALEEMHRQILLYGNTVVLSYNQITDSLAFLAGIYNDQSYEAVMNLIRNGRIKMSRYAGARTPSEYMQNSIRKYIDDATADTFRFSGLPTGTRAADLEEKRRDLQMVYEALRCSDPWLLRRESELAGTAGDREAARRYIMLERYVQMILLLSTREDTYIQERAAGENQPLTYFLEVFLESCGSGWTDDKAGPGSTGSVADADDGAGSARAGDARAGDARAGGERAGGTDVSAEGTDTDVSCAGRDTGSTGAGPDTIELPAGIDPEVLAGSLRIIGRIRAEHDMLLSRSLWYSWLREIREAAPDDITRRAVEFTEALIDICYNFTVESSISTVLGHSVNEKGEEDLIAAIWHELETYWSGFGTVHIPFCDRALYTERMEDHRMFDDSWDTFAELRKVDRVISDNLSQTDDEEPAMVKGPDRAALRRQHRRWVGSIIRGVFRNIAIAFAYILLFVAIQELLGLAQGVFQDSVTETASPWIKYAEWITTIVGIILFGIVSSVMSSVGGVQDILDSIRQIGCAIRDLIYISAASRRDRKRTGRS